VLGNKRGADSSIGGADKKANSGRCAGGGEGEGGGSANDDDLDAEACEGYDEDVYYGNEVYDDDSSIDSDIATLEDVKPFATREFDFHNNEFIELRNEYAIIT
jgi:hypothetical protein